jgi:MFS family permease
MILYGIACILYILSQNVLSVIAIRILESTSLAILWPTLEALVVDIYGEESVEKALRLYNVAWGLALIVAPAVSGVLITALTVKAPLYLAGAIAFLVCLPVSRIASPAQVVGKDPPRPVAKGSVSTEMWMAVVSSYLLSFVTGIVMSLFPAFALGLGLLAFDVGIVMLVFSVGRMVMFWFTVGIEARVQKRAMLLLSGLLFAVFMLVVVISPSFPVFLACFVFLGFGTGMAYSASLSIMMHTDASKRGSAAGKFESLMGVGSLMGPILGGAAAEVDSRGSFFVGGGVSAVFSLGLLAFMMKRGGREGVEPTP